MGDERLDAPGVKLPRGWNRVDEVTKAGWFCAEEAGAGLEALEEEAMGSGELVDMAPIPGSTKQCSVWRNAGLDNGGREEYT